MKVDSDDSDIVDDTSEEEEEFDDFGIVESMKQEQEAMDVQQMLKQKKDEENEQVWRRSHQLIVWFTNLIQNLFLFFPVESPA